MVSVENRGWHQWEKTGELMEYGGKSYPIVICQVCKMEGVQTSPLEVLVESKKNSKTKRRYCKYPPAKVKLIKLLNPKLKKHGFEIPSIVEAVPCPLEFWEEHSRDVWVFSIFDNKPLRLGENEYKNA